MANMIKNFPMRENFDESVLYEVPEVLHIYRDKEGNTPNGLMQNLRTKGPLVGKGNIPLDAYVIAPVLDRQGERVLPLDPSEYFIIVGIKEIYKGSGHVYVTPASNSDILEERATRDIVIKPKSRQIIPLKTDGLSDLHIFETLEGANPVFD